jgi:hypothetical protein
MDGGVFSPPGLLNYILHEVPDCGVCAKAKMNALNKRKRKMKTRTAKSKKGGVRYVPAASPPALAKTNTYTSWPGGPDPTGRLIGLAKLGGGAYYVPAASPPPLSNKNTYTSWTGGVDPTPRLYWPTGVTVDSGRKFGGRRLTVKVAAFLKALAPVKTLGGGERVKAFRVLKRNLIQLKNTGAPLFPNFAAERRNAIVGAAKTTVEFDAALDGVLRAMAVLQGADVLESEHILYSAEEEDNQQMLANAAVGGAQHRKTRKIGGVAAVPHVLPLSQVNTYTSWPGGVDPTAKLFNASKMIGGSAMELEKYKVCLSKLAALGAAEKRKAYVVLHANLYDHSSMGDPKYDGVNSVNLGANASADLRALLSAAIDACNELETGDLKAAAAALESVLGSAGRSGGGVFATRKRNGMVLRKTRRGAF